MNTAYRNLMLARAGAAVGAARAFGSVSHHGLKGQLREIIIRDLLRPLLPADIGIGSGEIISSCDQHSPQQDVVLFDRRIVPPILLEETHGIFPVEAVLFSIEVKSTLNRAELRQSHENAQQLQALKYLAGEVDDFGRPVMRMPILPLISSLIAFSSDLTSPPEIELQRYQEIYAGDEPSLKSICIVDRGCWMLATNGTWVTWETGYQFAELLGFMVLIMNSYRQIAASRSQPFLGQYLTDR
jgi:hypothetical protein